jgi:hypothetical protein
MTQSQGVALGWHVPRRWRLGNPAAVKTSITWPSVVMALRRSNANGVEAFSPGLARAPSANFGTAEKWNPNPNGVEPVPCPAVAATPLGLIGLVGRIPG